MSSTASSAPQVPSWGAPLNGPANGHAAAGVLPTGALPLPLAVDGGGGTSGIALASAHMLMQQASAAAQVINALAATLRDIEGARNSN